MLSRPRRNRRSARIRGLVQETMLDPGHLVLPVFIHEQDAPHPIVSISGHQRLSISDTCRLAQEAAKCGIGGLALFPAIADEKKTPDGVESKNEHGLLQEAIRAIKRATPELTLFTDVALDPYSSRPFMVSELYERRGIFCSRRVEAKRSLLPQGVSVEALVW